MGDYTELRVRATIKPEYRYIFDEKINHNRTWDDIAYFYPGTKWLDRWVNIPRYQFIPSGGSAYFQDDPEWELTFNPQTGFLQFQCNLKNYVRTIETFIEEVLSVAAQEVHECWTHFEYDPEPKRVTVEIRK